MKTSTMYYYTAEMYTNADEGLKTVEIIERIYKAAAL